MKNYLTHLGSVIVLVGLLLISLGCGEEKKETTGEKAKPEKSAKSGSKIVDNNLAEPDLESQMLGYWAPDKPAMMKEFQKQAEANPDFARMLPRLPMTMDTMAVEVKSGEVALHLQKTEVSTYEVTNLDAATNTLTLAVTDQGSPQTKLGTATIDGDRLTLVKDEDPPLILVRIDEAEFQKRRAAASKPPQVPLRPGGGGGGLPSPVPVPVPQ